MGDFLRFSCRPAESPKSKIRKRGKRSNFQSSRLDPEAAQGPTTMIGLESMARYASPVNPAIYPHLAMVLMAIGLFFTAWFFVYEVTSTKFTREVMKEVSISIVASIFMGFGTLFLILWVGIYV